MQGRVWASGIVFNPDQAANFAIHLNHPRPSTHTKVGYDHGSSSSTTTTSNNVVATLNDAFAQHEWSTACVAVSRRDGSPGFLVITNFAVVRPGAPMPLLAGDAWSRAVRSALLTPLLKQRFPAKFDWVDSGRYCLSKSEVPRFIISLFKKQRRGKCVTGMSPDQTDYSQWEPLPSKKALAPSSSDSSSSGSIPSSSSSSSASSPSSASSVHSLPSSGSDCDSQPCSAVYDTDIADITAAKSTTSPTLRALSTSTITIPTQQQQQRASDKPGRRSRARRRQENRAGRGDDDRETGYDADGGYESTDTVCG